MVEPVVLVNRRKRRAKSDRLDAVKLVEMLIRWCNGERKVWGVVHTPTVANEDHRQLHRELIVLKTERTAHVNAIKGLQTARRAFRFLPTFRTLGTI